VCGLKKPLGDRKTFEVAVVTFGTPATIRKSAKLYGAYTVRGGGRSLGKLVSGRNSLLSGKKTGNFAELLAFVARIGANLVANSECYRKIPCATEQGMVFARTGKSNCRTGNIMQRSGNRPYSKVQIEDPAADRH
jgi:hypothetical protein